jgi:hypothetical protein
MKAIEISPIEEKFKVSRVRLGCRYPQAAIGDKARERLDKLQDLTRTLLEKRANHNAARLTLAFLVRASRVTECAKVMVGSADLQDNPLWVQYADVLLQR